jgi:hypothetical protein
MTTFLFFLKSDKNKRIGYKPGVKNMPKPSKSPVSATENHPPFLKTGKTSSRQRDIWIKNCSSCAK